MTKPYLWIFSIIVFIILSGCTNVEENFEPSMPSLLEQVDLLTQDGWQNESNSGKITVLSQNELNEMYPNDPLISNVKNLVDAYKHPTDSDCALSECGWAIILEYDSNESALIGYTTLEEEGYMSSENYEDEETGELFFEDYGILKGKFIYLYREGNNLNEFLSLLNLD